MNPWKIIGQAVLLTLVWTVGMLTLLCVIGVVIHWIG